MADELTCPRCGESGRFLNSTDSDIIFDCHSEGMLECDGAYYVTEQSHVCTLRQAVKRAVDKTKDARIAELTAALRGLYDMYCNAWRHESFPLDDPMDSYSDNPVIARVKAALEGGAK